MSCFNLKKINLCDKIERELKLDSVLIDIKEAAKMLLETYLEYDKLSKSDKTFYDKLCLLVLKEISKAEQVKTDRLSFDSPRKLEQEDDKKI